MGGGVALAGDGDRRGRCEAGLAEVAERRGLSVEQLQADLRARLLTRVDAAQAAGRISSERAARLRERISEGKRCPGAQHARKRIAAFGMMRAAARFLGLDRQDLREQLPGNSLADLAKKQGKRVDALTTAMVAPASERLAKAVAERRITRARADAALQRLGTLADKLAARTFAKK